MFQICSVCCRDEMEKQIQRDTHPTLYSTFTFLLTKTRVTGPTGVWLPRVKWTSNYGLTLVWYVS